jgi:DNA polymerase-3 subunit epsilon
MAGLDLETTDSDPESARIVTACVGAHTADGWRAENWLLQQEQPIPADATAIHGITTEHADTHGQEPVEALTQIRDSLYHHWSQGRPVVAYNAPYDLTVLDRSLQRAGLGRLEIRGPVIDPKVIDQAVDKFRKGSRRLADVCRHYGVTLSSADAHGAEADARATCSLARRLGGARLPDEYSPIGRHDLHDLHQWQVDTYRADIIDFANYRLRKGNPLEDTNTDWPIRER